MAATVSAVFAAACLIAAGAQAAEPLPPLAEGGHLGTGWTVAALPQQTKPITRFSAQQVDKPLAWLEEDRDIRADFLRAFADEASVLPPLVLVGIGADADNTGGPSVAQVADLRFAD